MNKPKFSKPPLTDEEREKKLEAFINLSDAPTTIGKGDEPDPSKKLEKEKIKPLYLRAPVSLWQDVHEVMARTGLSMNAICMDLLRPAIKRKLKELREE